MEKLGLNELREEFLTYFESKDHIRLKSFSLVPDKDKSLLLINAGMAPLKPYFLGEKKMSKNRATSSQRCVRTADIDNVGKTDRHATFFEMLGNFSFGDYFKVEVIPWAWDFLTEKIGLDPDRMWITVFKDDDEAYRIWTEEVGIPKERMLRLGKEDNFWELDQGPCGPCSEIHYDRGPEFGQGTSPLDNDDRFMEVWNLVFTQFNRTAEGEYIPLAHPNIDTGMGLERLALITEHKKNIFELEEFLPIRQKLEQLSGKKYGEKEKWDRSFRVIIDHTKAIAFLVMDGVVPSNEGRGYVLRRLLRRAYRHGKLLGIEGEFLTETIDQILPVYQGEYPELIDGIERIRKIVVREEENFQQTIDSGLKLLQALISEDKKAGVRILTGSDVFKLYDTYGFPPDLTQEIAKEEGMDLDQEGFQEAMEKQKTMSRERRSGGVGWEDTEDIDRSGLSASSFTGYTATEGQGQVQALYKDGQRVESVTAGEEGLLVLDQTPFYGEGGGQAGDEGQLEGENFQADVLDTSKDALLIVYQQIRVNRGQVKVGDVLRASVDKDRREDIRRNHSATHLLDAALREVLGDHVKQAGSYVDDQGLRFDFSHYQAMSPEEIEKVEELVNRKIFESLPVRTEIKDRDQALEEGAIGLFEDKYQDQVRVVSMGDFSQELCGGTHVENTVQIGSFHILSEQGISSGVRRIEAISGRACYQLMKEQEKELRTIADKIKTKKENIHSRLDQILQEEKELRKDLEFFQSKAASELSNQMRQKAEELDGIRLFRGRFDGKSMDELKQLADSIKEDQSSYVIVLASANEDKVSWLVSADKKLNKEGLKAGDLVRDLAKATGGGGGGRPDFATGGGKDASRIDAALSSVVERIQQRRK